MAGVFWEWNSGVQSLTNGTDYYFAVLAAANHGIKIFEADVSFKGASATDPPIPITIAEISTMPTGGSSQAPVKSNSTDAESIQTTGHYKGTTTGTVVSTKRVFQVHPQDGKTVYFDPPLRIAGSKGLQVAINVPTTNNSAAVNFRGEE